MVIFKFQEKVATILFIKYFEAELVEKLIKRNIQIDEISRSHFSARVIPVAPFHLTTPLDLNDPNQKSSL